MSIAERLAECASRSVLDVDLCRDFALMLPNRLFWIWLEKVADWEVVCCLLLVSAPKLVGEGSAGGRCTLIQTMRTTAGVSTQLNCETVFHRTPSHNL